MVRLISIGFLFGLNAWLFASNDQIQIRSVENLGNGCARIIWERCPSGNEPVSYTIFRRIEDQNSWQNISTFWSPEEFPQYVDSVRVCDKQIYYRIASTNGDCTDSDTLKERIIDNENPATVQIDAISADPRSNHTVLSWTPCPSPDAYGYRILSGNGATEIDIILGAEKKQYTVQQPADTGLIFRISAVDSCMKGLLSEIKQTFLCKLTYHHCEKKIEISWSDPQKSMANIDFFKIMLSNKNGDFFPVARLPISSQRTAIIDVSDYLGECKIYVQASNADSSITANSISDSVFVSSPPSPNVMYIETLTVSKHNDSVEMHCLVDTKNIWENLFVYLADTLVKTVSYDELLQNKSFFLPNKQAYYHFKISDTCGTIIDRLSNFAKPILLTAKLSGDTVKLEVSKYEGWTNDDVPYRIFQILNGDTTPVMQFFPHLETTPFAFVVNNIARAVQLEVFVEAYEESVNPYGIKSKAKSNTVNLLVKEDIDVHFASGFKPNGISPTYHPFFISLPNDEIQFYILNKFGQVVFTTTLVNEGWDGKYKNTDQPPGTYIYVFVIKRGEKTSKKYGSFTMIR